MRLNLILLVLLLSGCELPKPEKKDTDLQNHWCHSIGDGTPHRMSVLADRTEVLTVGHHSHGRFLLLLRYQGESKFTLINDSGLKREYINDNTFLNKRMDSS